MRIIMRGIQPSVLYTGTYINIFDISDMMQLVYVYKTLYGCTFLPILLDL
jgi:hypothetical protein